MNYLYIYTSYFAGPAVRKKSRLSLKKASSPAADLSQKISLPAPFKLHSWNSSNSVSQSKKIVPKSGQLKGPRMDETTNVSVSPISNTNYSSPLKHPAICSVPSKSPTMDEDVVAVPGPGKKYNYLSKHSKN